MCKYKKLMYNSGEIAFFNITGSVYNKNGMYSVDVQLARSFNDLACLEKYLFYI